LLVAFTAIYIFVIDSETFQREHLTLNPQPSTLKHQVPVYTLIKSFSWTLEFQRAWTFLISPMGDLVVVIVVVFVLVVFVFVFVVVVVIVVKLTLSFKVLIQYIVYLVLYQVYIYTVYVQYI
jgi:hypothetical protein